MLDAQDPQTNANGKLGFEFECPITVFKAEDKPNGRQRRIAGVISTDQKDRQDEVILQEGLDFSTFLSNGWLNNNHGSQVTDVLGFPESIAQYKAGQTLPDGKMADANCTWVEGYLLDTPKATEIWQLAQALSKTHRRLGYSVEGEIVSRSGPGDKTIAQAKVRNVAVTHCPVNANSYLEVLARSLSAQNQRLSQKSMTLTDAAGSQGPVNPNVLYTGKGAGQVISPESLAKKKKMRDKKKRVLTRSQAVAYIKSIAPVFSEALCRAIVDSTLYPKGRGI